MDLRQFFAILTKHSRLLAFGLLLGFIIFLISSFTIDFNFQGLNNWPLIIKARPDSLYETSISIAIDSPRFGMGRAGLSANSWPAFNRSIELAPSYSYIVSSDFMRKRIEAKIGKLKESEHITSENIEKTPIIMLRVEGPSRHRIIRIAYTAIEELKQYVKEMQDKEKTPADDRIKIRALGYPSKPKSADHFRTIKLFLAFLSPILMSLALAFIIENIENSNVMKMD